MPQANGGLLTGALGRIHRERTGTLGAGGFLRLFGANARRFCILVGVLAFTSLIHLITYALVARAIGGFASDWAGFFLRFLVRDSRHAEIAVDSLREIDVTGFALAGPVGAAL